MKKMNIWRYFSAANHEILKLQHKLGVSFQIGKPIGAMIELCNICNLKCTLCPTGNSDLNRPKGFMEEEVFRMIVDQLDDRFTKDFIPAMWGESLLHPKFLVFMKYARKKDWRISLSTNGNVDKDSTWYDDFVATGIDEIICAVDGHDQDSYSVYRRNGSLMKVHGFLAGLRTARDKAGVTTPHIVGQVHLLRANEKHLVEIKSNIGPFVDEIRMKEVRMFYTSSSKSSVIDEEYSSLRPEKDEYRFPCEGRPRCPSMLYYVNINWEGEVIACCKDPENILRFGNIKNNSINSIRKSRKFAEMNQKLIRNIYEHDICKKCFTS